MITRKLIAALVGLTLVAGTAVDASAALATSKDAGKPVAAASVKNSGKVAGKISTKHHRVHVARHAPKHVKVVRLTRGKRLALSHAVKRTAHKHA